MLQRHQGSWRAIRDSGLTGRLALLCFGVWLHAADGLMVATVIPSMVRDIAGAALIPWIFALYEIGSIVAGAAKRRSTGCQQKSFQ